MNTTALPIATDPHHLGHGALPAERERTGSGAGGPASKRIIVGYGFWIFILSDIIMFSTLFAAYAVLAGNRAGGPGPHELFDLRNTAIETALLLLSSFTCGMASLAVGARNQSLTQLTLLITGLLGFGFLLREIHEFHGIVAQGAGPTHSAFASAFFTLVGCHGVHVTAGLLWLGTMMAQFMTKGYQENVRHRFLCFTLFWHALDIIWVGIFSLVYLAGKVLP
jgi:cytochrome o ubiquinol oxidase subunit 3